MLAEPFGREHGLSDLSSSGAEEPSTGLGLDLDGSEITLPTDLPPTLFLGKRHDRSFRRDHDSWRCFYRFEGAPFLEIHWRDGRWQLNNFFDGMKTGTTHATGSLMDALMRYIAYSNLDSSEKPWEGRVKEWAECTACIQYHVPSDRSTIVTGIPGGRQKALVCPVSPGHRQTLEARKDLIRRNLGAILVSSQGERTLQLVSREPIAMETAERVVYELEGAHQPPVSEVEIASRTTPIGTQWRLSVRARTHLAYFLFPWRRTLELVDTLRRWQVLADPLSGIREPAVRLAHRSVLAGLDEVIAQPPNQPAMVEYEPWLLDAPVLLAAFPSLPREALQERMEVTR